MPSLPLSGLRIVELGSGDTLGYCGKLFSDFGADVIKIEPQGGDPGRRIPPLADVGEGKRESLTFAWLNTNKKSIIADPENTADANRILELLASADLLLDARHPDEIKASLISHDRLRKADPGLADHCDLMVRRTRALSQLSRHRFSVPQPCRAGETGRPGRRAAGAAARRTDRRGRRTDRFHSEPRRIVRTCARRAALRRQQSRGDASHQRVRHRARAGSRVHPSARWHQPGSAAVIRPAISSPSMAGSA